MHQKRKLEEVGLDLNLCQSRPSLLKGRQVDPQQYSKEHHRIDPRMTFEAKHLLLEPPRYTIEAKYVATPKHVVEHPPQLIFRKTCHLLLPGIVYATQCLVTTVVLIAFSGLYHEGGQHREVRRRQPIRTHRKGAPFSVYGRHPDRLACIWSTLRLVGAFSSLNAAHLCDTDFRS